MLVSERLIQIVQLNGRLGQVSASVGGGIRACFSFSRAEIYFMSYLFKVDDFSFINKDFRDSAIHAKLGTK